MFSNEVSSKLGFYVYRLIDPRNGETFNVGKGKGNRVFSHAKGEEVVEDELSEKLLRIRQIRLSGFEVAHVIHRHGLSEDQAFEVEAALIDAYPEATNLAGGRASDERGLMHANQVVERYKAREAKFRHRVLIIKINRTATERESVYAAVRFAWKLDPKRAEKAEYVLAVQQGIIVGVFVADDWFPATEINFPDFASDRKGRWGFVGHEAPESVAKKYLRCRIPDVLQKKAQPRQYGMLTDFRLGLPPVDERNMGESRRLFARRLN